MAFQTLNETLIILAARKMTKYANALNNKNYVLLNMKHMQENHIKIFKTNRIEIC